MTPPQAVQEASEPLQTNEDTSPSHAKLSSSFTAHPQTMFAIKSLSKYIFGGAGKENLVELPQGQLYIVRPHSPKGYSELIFKDAAAYIRRTGQEFQYQLVIQRAYEEGEAELDEDNAQEGAVAVLGDKDEKVFPLDEELRFRVDLRDDGETVLAWKDLSGDIGDLYEFIPDSDTRPETTTTFELVAAQCQFERKYRRDRQEATDDDLREFAFDDEPAIPQASPLASPSGRSPGISPVQSSSRLITAGSSPHTDMARITVPTAKMVGNTPTKAPKSRDAPVSKEILTNEKAELHLFDFNSGLFVRQDPAVQAKVFELGGWDYWLQISGSDQEWLGQKVVPDINPVFNIEHLSFIFNHYSDDGSAYSWLLRFKDRETIDRFQHGLMQALYEHANQIKWAKVSSIVEREYVLDAFNDLVLEDQTLDDQREAEAEEEDEEYEEANEGRPDFDEDEDEDEEDEFEKDGNVNSQLAVGAMHDRSFVVRGNKIGVFSHTNNNQLKYSTTINDVKTPKGKGFAPKKVMLHAEDRDMVLQNANDPHSLFRMDLEYGKVVDEWKVDDNVPVNVFTPANKFAQKTGEQTFIGLSGNALYRIDPRLHGNKLVESELKQYASKNDFSAAATTEKGYIAVASNKGDIRLFDRLGIQAKTALPALGDPIIGMDTSADGRWVLATTKTYILLIDVLQQGGKNDGKLGFEKAFPKDAKPQPRRLTLTPSHVAQFQHETKAALSFTPAHFNTGDDAKETSIITASGPFVITWSLDKVLKGQRDPYKIKRYGDEIKADNFRFGSDKNIVVALPNEVNMVARKALQRPTRESIMATPQRSKGRGSYLSRNDVVNSPY